MNKGLRIIGVTLPSIDEAKQLPLELRFYKDWWWLRSAGSYSNFAAVVRNDGSLSAAGNTVDASNAVRPVLQIDIKSSIFKVGDTFIFGGKYFDIITDEFAFCQTDIGTCAFREDWEAEDANTYEKSDAKKFVDEWFVDSMTPYEETPIPAQLSTEGKVKNMRSNYESITFAKNNYDNEEQMWDDIRDTIRILSKQDYQFKFCCDEQGVGVYVLQFNYKDWNMSGVSLDWIDEDTE